MKEKIPERYPPITEVKEKEESTMPTIEELDNLLNTSKELLENAVISEKEIDEMIEKRQEALEQIQNIELILESRLRKVENFNPLKDLTPDDYEGLVQEGIIDVAYAERLKKLDELISQLESVEFPTLEAKAKLEELASVRRAIREKIESQIEQRQEEIAERREELRNKILEHYGKRIKDLEKIVAEIESNPQVIERLQTMAEKEYKEFQEGIEKERQRIIHEATRCIQSLSARHARVINRIGEILDDEKFINKLMNILWDRDEKKLKIELNKIRNVLIKSIIEGEGKKQIKDPAEVVPWKIRSTSIRYIDAMNFLLSREVEEILEEAAENGDKQAEKLLDERTKIKFQNKILRELFGPQWITDPKTNEKRLGPFWAAFEERKKNDEAGITEARRKEREEAAKREAELQQKIKEIIEKGGFIVEMPIIKEVKGKKEVVGRQTGAVLLEKCVSKKGNQYWKIVEVAGISGLKIGDSSPLDMRSFPWWLRKAAERYFREKGNLEDLIQIKD